MGNCSHDIVGAPAPANTEGCEECLRTGGRWVHLRVCRHCGHVGCCDSSPGRHATAHYKTTQHATMQSFEPGEDWGWCYVEQRQLGPFTPRR
jgi:hypothetical protein